MRKVVRITDRYDKFTMLDIVLHWFGIHLLKECSTNTLGKYYCRVCGKYFDSFDSKGERRSVAK